MTNDCAFTGDLLATATASRVDVWKMEQPKDDEAQEISPVHSLRKFDDLVTALALRKDGVVAAGDKLGRIQLLSVK